MRLEPRESRVLLGTLAALVLLNTTTLGADPWPFEPGALDPRGALGWFAELADEEWNTNFLKAPALLAGVAVAIATLAYLAGFRLPRWLAAGLAAGVAVALLVPAVLLQVALRDASEPWFFTNDSTYQIELAGDLVLDGETPYGHDYRGSGLERFYRFDGTVTQAELDDRVALRHFAYFPGTPVAAAVWRLLPRPFDDYRLFVALATLLLLPAALAFPGPFGWRLAAGAALAANPLAVRAAWFGTADAPCLLLVLLGFALLGRRRPLAAAVAIGVAVLFKQFALVALPFALLLLLRRHGRRELWRAAAAFGAVVLVGALPFVVAGARGFWDDTIAYGTDTYPIVGHGLSELLYQAGAIAERSDPYPFALLALLVWAPVTAWLARVTWRSPTPLLHALVGFGLSHFVLVYIGRSFHTSYLVYPLAALVVATLVAAVERERSGYA